jgi:transposase
MNEQFNSFESGIEKEARMEPSPFFVGVEVSTTHLNVTLHPSGSRRVFPNTAMGVATLAAYLQTLHPKVIALESTGGTNRPWWWP